MPAVDQEVSVEDVVEVFRGYPPRTSMTVEEALQVVYDERRTVESYSAGLTLILTEGVSKEQLIHGCALLRSVLEGWKENTSEEEDRRRYSRALVTLEKMMT
ncbi:MAG: hypothetical protein WD200_01085 [Candidatus Andersenbacteria bacterium]